MEKENLEIRDAGHRRPRSRRASMGSIGKSSSNNSSSSGRKKKGHNRSRSSSEEKHKKNSSRRVNGSKMASITMAGTLIDPLPGFGRPRERRRRSMDHSNSNSHSDTTLSRGRRSSRRNSSSGFDSLSSKSPSVSRSRERRTTRRPSSEFLSGKSPSERRRRRPSFNLISNGGGGGHRTQRRRASMDWNSGSSHQRHNASWDTLYPKKSKKKTPARSYLLQHNQQGNETVTVVALMPEAAQASNNSNSNNPALSDFITDHEFPRLKSSVTSETTDPAEEDNEHGTVTTCNMSTGTHEAPQQHPRSPTRMTELGPGSGRNNSNRSGTNTTARTACSHDDHSCDEPSSKNSSPPRKTTASTIVQRLTRSSRKEPQSPEPYRYDEQPPESPGTMARKKRIVIVGKECRRHNRARRRASAI